jgi:hypothetical protein
MQVEFRFLIGIGKAVRTNYSDLDNLIRVFQRTIVANVYCLHLDGVNIEKQSFLSIRD